MKAISLKASLLGLGMLVTATSSLAQEPDMVVFGDSLSDPGNYFQIFGEQEVQPFEALNLPNGAYARGGHHFTNGETWVEQLTRDLRSQQSGSPAHVAPAVFTNYAVGRARARNALLDGVFSEQNLTAQVDQFQADFASGIPTEATYVIWIGSNDTADAILATLSPANAPNGPAIAQALIGAAVGNTADEILRLYGMGARNFLVLGIPDFSVTPVFDDIAALGCISAPVPAQCEQFVLWIASQTSAGYNGALGLALTNLSQLPGMSIQTVDVKSFLGDIIADPGAYGLTNVSDACTVPATTQQAFCQNPDAYLFWDGQHPTRVAHGLLADHIAGQLAP